MAICHGGIFFFLSSSRGDIAGSTSCREEASSPGKTHQIAKLISHRVVFHLDGIVNDSRSYVSKVTDYMLRKKKEQFLFCADS